MQKKINTKLKFLTLNRSIILSGFGAFLLVVLLSNASGPAQNGTFVTGAPFNSGLTCTDCHSGGNFGATMSTKLINSANAVVTSYIPDSPYTLKITMNKTTGTPNYGFQTTCATSTKVDVNKWGVLPKTMHSLTALKHTYVEHSKPLTSGVIKIPWTAPKKGTGSVIFYTAGNEVNLDGGTNGDQPVNKKLTITEAPAPPSSFASLNLNAAMQNNQAVVSFHRADVQTQKDIVLEKSIDDVNYSAIDRISPKGDDHYTYNDRHIDSKAFYRLKIANEDGSVTYSNVAPVSNPSKIKNQLSLYTHAGTGFIMFHNDGLQQRVQVTYADISGNIIYTEVKDVNAGDNMWAVPRDKVKGMTIVNVLTKDGNRSSLKIGVN